MDIEPIYCAEQIVVPVDLADVLKAYTKEVIRRQPENLLHFSAKYFTNLANVASSVGEAAAPERGQLKLVLERAGGEASLTSEQIGALCNQAGIAKSIVAKVLAAGSFGSEVSVDKFLFLLLAMSCESFTAVLAAIFEIFGATLETQRFITLISYLAPDMDPDITSQFMASLGSALLDIESVNYASVCALPLIQQKLSQ